MGEACELRRPQLARVFVDLRDEAAQEARDAARRRERRERRFRELLEDYLRWPDDKNATYEDLEPSLARHSAYDGVPRGRRRELFRAESAKRCECVTKEGGGRPLATHYYRTAHIAACTAAADRRCSNCWWR